MTGHIILRISYGINAESDEDHFIYIAERSVQAFSTNASAGRNLVDALPFCEL